MSRLVSFFLVFGVFGFLLLFSSKNVKADCGGTISCGVIQTVCSCSGGGNGGCTRTGDSCVGTNGPGVCSCTDTCQQVDFKSCSRYLNAGACTGSPKCQYCDYLDSCSWSNPPPGPTPTPPPGGGGGGTCGSCSNPALVASACSGIAQWCIGDPGGGCHLDSCTCGGAGCGGGGGNPACPGASSLGCSQICGEPCVVTADCRSDVRARGAICIGGKCVNPACPNNTNVGTLCDCNASTGKCGDKCGIWNGQFLPLCGDGKSSCSWLASAPGCGAPNDTYCIPTNPKNGYGLGNCAIGQGYQYLITPSGAIAQYQSQVVAACTAPSAWFQVVGGNAISSSGIASNIPSTCTLPNCIPQILPDWYGFPGNAIYGQFLNQTGTAISSKKWNANTAPLGKTYDYAYFNSVIPGSVKMNNRGNVINAGDITNGGSVSGDGYYWYKVSGDAIIAGDVPITGSRKIILFVSGNLTINGKVTIQTKGQGFFMAIVGGMTSVNGTLNNGNFPIIEGIYVTNGFSTGAGSPQFYVRGSVVNYGTLTLARDMTNNGTAPAERFEFAPELILLFPPDLTPTKATWKEVIP